jgi:hypothetical protein
VYLKKKQKQLGSAETAAIFMKAKKRLANALHVFTLRDISRLKSVITN